MRRTACEKDCSPQLIVTRLRTALIYDGSGINRRPRRQEMRAGGAKRGGDPFDLGPLIWPPAADPFRSAVSRSISTVTGRSSHNRTTERRTCYSHAIGVEPATATSLRKFSRGNHAARTRSIFFWGATSVWGSTILSLTVPAPLCARPLAWARARRWCLSPPRQTLELTPDLLGANLGTHQHPKQEVEQRCRGPFTGARSSAGDGREMGTD